jgi:hypothetical protein
MPFTFEYIDMKDELVNALKAGLLAFSFGAVKVLKSDPQSPAEIPCIGINRIDDNENERTLGDFSDADYDKDTKTYTTEYGTFFAEAVEVRVWHVNADERDKVYRTVKAILFAARIDLVQKGVLNISLRSGKDEQDTTMTQAPMALYWASITMSYLNPLDVHITEAVEPITAIYDYNEHTRNEYKMVFSENVPVPTDSLEVASEIGYNEIVPRPSEALNLAIVHSEADELPKPTEDLTIY